jgi:hypothetical protein
MVIGRRHSHDFLELTADFGARQALHPWHEHGDADDGEV